MDEQVQTDPTTEIDPNAERLEIELPPELLPPAEGEEPKPVGTVPDEPKAPEGGETPAAASPTAKTEEKPTSEPEKPTEPGKVVPLAALQEERRKRKDVSSLYEQAESARKAHEAELARLKAQAELPKVERPAVKWNDLEDMETVAKHIQAEIDARVAAVKVDSEIALRKTRVHLSEAMARAVYPDYDEMLQKGGITEAVGLDPATGKIRDPFLAKWIYESENPAQTAYDYACGKLSKTSVAEAKAQGKEEGKREVVERILHNAQKPKGIANIPPAPKQAGISREDIYRMSEEQKRRLFKERPDVERWYLMG